MSAEWNRAVDAHHDLMAAFASKTGIDYLTGFVEASAKRTDYYEGSESPEGPDVDRQFALATLKGVMGGLPISDTMWVDRDVVDLVAVAAESFQAEAIYADDLICERAFVLLEAPLFIRDTHGKLMGFRAFAWNKVWVENMGKEALVLSLYTHRLDNDDFSVLQGEMFPRIGASDLMISHYNIVYFGDARWLHDEANADLSRNLQVFWRLAQQEIIIPGVRGIDRATRRRAAKWREIKNITIYTLRRQRQQRHDEGESAVEWSHRWMVRGHWRNQPYVIDSAIVHRQIWIESYVKGPEDKPFVAKKRVYDFRR